MQSYWQNSPLQQQAAAINHYFSSMALQGGWYESPQESYDKYARARRETEAALARYPSGWSEAASEWDKIP